MSKLELWLPLKGANITQRFGLNANGSYSRDGLKGHTSTDQVTFKGDSVLFSQKGLVYSVLNKDNPDLDKYRAVFTLVEGWNGSTGLSEVSYGHLGDIAVEPGQFVYAGDLCGTESNTGEVYSGGVRVKAKDKQGNAGVHLHGPQVRPVERVSRVTEGEHYLHTGYGIYRDREGFFYRIPLYNNGYNGCIDDASFSNGKWAGDALRLRIMASLASIVVGLYKKLMQA